MTPPATLRVEAQTNESPTDPLTDHRLQLLEQVARQTDHAVIQQTAAVHKNIMKRVEELTEVANTMVLAQPAALNRITKLEAELESLREEVTKYHKLIGDLLKLTGTSQATPIPASTPGFKSYVVRPGITTPAATGGPKGTSARPK